jgi:surfactin family lipopeptide synthetase A
VLLSEAKRALLQTYLSGNVSHPLAAAPEIGARPSREPALLSLSQEQLVLRERSMAGFPLYNECITIRMKGALEITVLERSLAEIVRRHEIWRTSYDVKDGRLVQIVHPTVREMRLPVVDLRELRKYDAHDEAQKFATEEASRPFDLSRGPLFRATLLRTEDADYRLILIAHLSIVDGLSVYQLFPGELAALYSAFCANKASPLRELPIQYADYAYWQRRWLEDGELSRQLSYWRKQLAGDSLMLRWPAYRPAVHTCCGAIRAFELNRSLANALKELARREGVTLFTILLASFATLMYCYTSQIDFIIGTPSSSGRKRSEVQPLLGYFLNPVALRIDLRNDPSLRELLLRVRTLVAQAISCDDLPIEIIAKELRPDQDPSGNSFFRVAISLQPKTAVELPEWQVTSMDGESGGAIWDLYVAFINTGDGLIGRVQYNVDVFPGPMISDMVRDLQIVMSALIADPRQPISMLAVGNVGSALAHTRGNS